MLQAMFSGVSGLQVHQTKLNVIGNNIANVNTIGFKAGRVTFTDQLSQSLRSATAPSDTTGGMNPAQVGLGVALGAVDTVQTQGNLQTTGKTTDMAIQGDGFFMVTNGSQIFYTRDGTFDKDSSGVLGNPSNGLKLVGYQADANGNIDTSKTISSSSILSMPIGSMTSVKQTTQAAFTGNLSAASALQSTNIKIAGSLDSSTTPAPINATVYDSLGNAHTVKVTFSNPTRNVGPTPNADQRWQVDTTVDGSAASSQLLYERSGKFQFESPAGTSVGPSMVVNVTGASGAGNFPLSLDFSGLTNASTLVGSANGQGGTNPVQSSTFALTGALNMDSVPPTTSIVVHQVVAGVDTAYTVDVALTNPSFNPSGAGVPTGATASWDIKLSNGATTLYDSTAGESKIYYVPGQGYVTASSTGANLGGTINLTGAAATAGTNQGQQVASGFSLSLDLSKMTTSSTSGNADGIAGPPSPVWNTSVKIYDSLGIKHEVSLKFSRTLVGTGAPAGATGRWEWQASENGTVLSSSNTAGNNPLYFDSAGQLLVKSNQTIPITPLSGGSPFSITADFSSLTQLANSSSSVAAASQDGYPVGALQTFNIGKDGIITGVFANGQSRVLGMVATATFLNPAGLDKVGDNIFTDSSNSGLAQIGQPSTQNRGKISTGYVEMSNVDLSTEFTNLIVTQRGFQANTRIVSTIDDLLQDVINLKR